MRRALAYVFALRVYARAVLARLRIFALVDVRAIAPRTVQFVALVALAPEHAEYVLATTEHAQIAEHLALVYVHAHLLVVLVGMHEPHLAFATKRARIIETVPVLAEGVIVRALVDVFAGVTVATEASIANALK